MLTLRQISTFFACISLRDLNALLVSADFARAWSYPEIETRNLFPQILQERVLS